MSNIPTDPVEINERKARARAEQDSTVSRLRYRQYGDLFNTVKGGAPLGLFVGHLMRVNPFGHPQPPLTGDGRVGFMKVSPTESADAGIAWKKITNPAAGELKPGIFAWSRALNSSAKELPLDLADLITTPDATFWKLTYLYHTLGEAAFDAIWETRDAGDPDLYHAFIAAAINWDKTLGGWPIVKLKKVVLQDCPYVFQTARYFGALQTAKFGKLPEGYL